MDLLVLLAASLQEDVDAELGVWVTRGNGVGTLAREALAKFW